MRANSFSRILLKLSATLCIPIALTNAATVTVPTTASTIQSAVNMSTSNDTILIQDGTYTGSGNYNIDLHGKSVVIMSQNGPDFTILDLGGDSLNPKRAFIIDSGEDTTTTIRGLRISGAVTMDSSGGAILLTNSAARILNCVFENCRVAFDSSSVGGVMAPGGAIYASGSRLYVDSCTFYGNTAHSGGAIHSTFCDELVMMNSSFTANRAIAKPRHLSGWGDGGVGGALYSYSTVVLIENCSFAENSSNVGGAFYAGHCPEVELTNCRFEANIAYGFGTFFSGFGGGRGGAIYVHGSSVAVQFCLFMRNHVFCLGSSAPGVGGAVYLSDNQTSVITKSTFFANETEYCSSLEQFGKGSSVYVSNHTVEIESCIFAFDIGGSPIRCSNGTQSIPTISNTNIFGNQESDWTHCIDSQEGENGNFSFDPLFCDTANLDLSLQPGSPCAPQNTLTQSQIGAFGVGCATTSCCDLPGDADNSSNVNIADVTFLINHIFNSGIALPCYYEADANASGTVNIADVTYLIARIFSSGPEPICIEL